ncbi:MAG: hypothetical protein LDL41_08310 [Coleofasciculus sp. S288]|nr:hypothetical protein [Coleofasciculus sp. S288]
MSSFHQTSALTTVGVVITALVSGCGETKVSQCNKLIEVINKGQPLVAEFQQETIKASSSLVSTDNSSAVKQQATQSATVFNKFASDWDKYNQEIKAVELADEKIIGFQKRYGEAGDKLGQGIRDMSKVMTELSEVKTTPQSLGTLQKVSSDLNTISQKLVSVGQESDKVVTELNSYCSKG